MAQQDIQISVPIIGVGSSPVAYADQILDEGTNMTLDEVAKKSVAYGPYASVAAAHTALSAVGLNTVGTTVGISDLYDTVVEYWYQGGTEQANLIKKVLGSNDRDAVSFDGFIPLEPVTIIDGSASEPDAILYSRNANRFVAKKDDKYYDNWKERVLYNNGNEPYTSKLYPYNGKSYTWDGTTFEAEGAEAVRYDAQTLTAQQKEQAAQNIGLDVVIKGDVQQSLSDAQKVNAQNNMIGKAYAPAQFSGLGKKVLAKNIEEVGGVDKNYMTQAFFKNGNNLITNTVFVIQYDYELKENVEIGAGCILEFDGGSISGAFTIVGNNTKIKANNTIIFGNDITIQGTWNIPNITSEWFPNISDYTHVLRNIFSLTNNIYDNIVVITGNEKYVSAVSEGEHIVLIKSNTKVILNTVIRLTANALNEYAIFGIVNANNVQFEGGNIVGDLIEHTSDSGQHGVGISVRSSSNVSIKDVTTEDLWGDGIYIGSIDDATMSTNVFVENVVCKRCRRNGMSITGADDITVNNSSFVENGTIRGTLPMAGLDVERNEHTYTNNVKILDCDFSGNEKDGLIYTKYLTDGYLNNQNGIISGCKSDNSMLIFNSCQVIDCECKFMLLSKANNVVVQNSKITEFVRFEGNLQNISFENCILSSSNRVHGYGGIIVVVNNSNYENITFDKCTFDIEDPNGVISLVGGINVDVSTLQGDKINIFNSAINATGRYFYYTIGDIFNSIIKADAIYAHDAYKKNVSLVNNIIEVNSNAIVLGTDIDSNIELNISNNAFSSKNNGDVILDNGHSANIVAQNNSYNGSKLLTESPTSSSLSQKNRGLLSYNEETKQFVFWDGVSYRDILSRFLWPEYAFAGETTKPHLDQTYPGYQFNNATTKNLARANREKTAWIDAFGFKDALHAGYTANRPTNCDIGHFYFDMTIVKPIWWSGDTNKGDNGWVDANGEHPNPQTT